jgi:phosphoribosylaminoimidazole-succinocarboxamide synthase
VPATKSDNLQLLYQGSVKRVYAAAGNPDRLWFEFSDDYSVFDWGKMPDTIENKGRALTVLGAYFFERLADAQFWKNLKSSASLKKFSPDWLNEVWNTQAYNHVCHAGMPTHFHGLRSADGALLSLGEAAAAGGAVFMEVERAEVFRPVPAVVLGQPVYYYPPLLERAAKRLVPLEVVFRFGMPSGSSLKERLENNPDYRHQLGLHQPAKEGEFFDRGVLEFFTKLEPKDRLLSLSEALNISTLTADQFKDLSEFSVLLALALFTIFAEKGIELWDGKFEFIFDGRRIVLADSIGPDELRLIYEKLQLSKEMIRQVYRGSDWEKNLKKAQKLAVERGSLDWKTICQDELHSQPDVLPASFKSKINQLYGVLANHVSGQALFAQQPELKPFAGELHAENKSCK